MRLTALNGVFGIRALCSLFKSVAHARPVRASACGLVLMIVAGSAQAELLLECVGLGNSHEAGVQNKYGFGNFGGSQGSWTQFGNSANTVKVPGTISVSIFDNGKGHVDFPEFMLPLINNGTRTPFTKLNIEESVIYGEVRINALNFPEITINRMTGQISVDGPFKFGFSGKCRKIEARRQF